MLIIYQMPDIIAICHLWSEVIIVLSELVWWSCYTQWHHHCPDRRHDTHNNDIDYSSEAPDVRKDSFKRLLIIVISYKL